MPEPIKSIAKELAMIKKMAGPLPVTARLKDSPALPAELIKNKRSLLRFPGSGQLQVDTGEDVDFSLANDDMGMIGRGYLRNTSFSSNQKNLYSHEVTIWKLCTTHLSLEKNFYCRKIIPIKESEKHLLFHTFDVDSFACDDHRQLGIVEAEVSGSLFHIYVVHDDENYFLIIDCLAEHTPDMFSELAWSVTVSIGYLTGYLPQDEEYNFYYTNEELLGFCGFDYSVQRKTIDIFYHPVNTNPHAWVKDPEQADKYDREKFKSISFSQLSRLCQLVHDTDDIKAILLLILESMSGSLLVMPAGLSVALEGLSDYFYEENAEKLNPMKDDIKADVIKQFKQVLQGYKNNEGINSYSTLEKKVDNINSPTNGDKLKAPFTILGIPLTAKEEEAILYRNDFLHGNISLKPPAKIRTKDKKQYNMDSFEISLRLYTIISLVIMKMIGYEGYVINHAKTQEQGMNKSFDEPHYKELNRT